MGRRDRERIERIRKGEEEPIAALKATEAQKVLSNPIVSKLVALRSRQGVVRTLGQASTEDQIDVLRSTAAANKPSKVREALMRKAPAEMDKAICAFQREVKPVTVESLTEEAKNTPSFVALCEKVGLEMSWFEELAKKRMEAHGL